MNQEAEKVLTDMQSHGIVGRPYTMSAKHAAMLPQAMRTLMQNQKDLAEGMNDIRAMFMWVLTTIGGKFSVSQEELDQCIGACMFKVDKEKKTVEGRIVRSRTDPPFLVVGDEVARLDVNYNIPPYDKRPVVVAIGVNGMAYLKTSSGDIIEIPAKEIVEDWEIIREDDLTAEDLQDGSSPGQEQSSIIQP